MGYYRKACAVNVFLLLFHLFEIFLAQPRLALMLRTFAIRAPHAGGHGFF